MTDAEMIRLDETLPEDGVLRVRVGPQTLAEIADAARLAMRAAEAGAPFEPVMAVGFEQMAQMLAVFTPKRWELLAALRSLGPSSVRALARHLGRDYKNAHADVAALAEWMAVQRLPDGRVHVPWRDIMIDLRLPELAQAA